MKKISFYILSILFISQTLAQAGKYSGDVTNKTTTTKSNAFTQIKGVTLKGTIFDSTNALVNGEIVSPKDRYLGYSLTIGLFQLISPTTYNSGPLIPFYKIKPYIDKNVEFRVWRKDNISWNYEITGVPLYKYFLLSLTRNYGETSYFPSISVSGAARFSDCTQLDSYEAKWDVKSTDSYELTFHEIYIHPQKITIIPH